MNSLNKFLIIVTLLIIVSTSYSSSINANNSLRPADSESVDFSSESFRSDENADVHMFCYIKSGEVDHHCPYEFWHGTFFGILIKIGNDIGTVGIGSLYMHLTGEGDELRLTVSKFFRTINYTEDVNVSVKGFFGVFQPTGHISTGSFYGFALITKVIPLKNQ